MKRRTFLLGGLAAVGATAAPAPRVVSLAGRMVNTTNDVSAPASLVLTFEGEKVTAEFKVTAPLVGNGTLAGSFRQGWLELAGKISATATIELRGVMNALDYRGTYLVSFPGEPVQYGRFELAVER